jgi:hypothetical protein
MSRRKINTYNCARLRANNAPQLDLPKTQHNAVLFDHAQEACITAESHLQHESHRQVQASADHQ